MAEGLGDGERLAEIGRLGARLVQRAVEEEVTAFLGRAPVRAEGGSAWVRGTGTGRARWTAEGELEIQVPQIQGAAASTVTDVAVSLKKFVSSVIPNGQIR